MEQALTTYLLASSGLTTLVGTRVHWASRPQGSTLPAVILTRISGVRDYTLAGASGYVESRVQIDCWARTYGAAKTTAQAVRNALHALLPAGSPPILGLSIDGERDSFEGDPPEALSRTSLDVIIHHHEP